MSEEFTRNSRNNFICSKFHVLIDLRSNFLMGTDYSNGGTMIL